MLGPDAISNTYFDPHVALRKQFNNAFSHKAALKFLPGMAEIVEAGMREWAQQGVIQAQPCIKRIAFTACHRSCARVLLCVFHLML